MNRSRALNIPKRQSPDITADELFSRLDHVVKTAEHTPHAANRLMHEILVLCCQEGLKGQKILFGNLFSQVDFLCKQYHLNGSKIIAVQKMRRDSNQIAALPPAQILDDCHALAAFISAVFGVADTWNQEGTWKYPEVQSEKKQKTKKKTEKKSLRCIVRAFTDDTITAIADDESKDQTLHIDYSSSHLQHLKGILHEGMQLNLVDYTTRENADGRQVEPGLIIVEPDYLIDISSIASCFSPIGHHPLSYLLKKISPPVNTHAILLGNFAGQALDDIINSEDDYNWQQTLRTHFRLQGLDYCTCTDFNRKEDFKQAAARQVVNIQQIVNELFGKNFHNYNKEHAILEPSFVCEKLGLQGRVDLMTTDFRLLIEQKSGKNFNIERQQPNEFGSFQKEDHYVQLLLYYGVLLYNFNLPNNQVDTRLLYSKYPLPGGLVAVSFYQKLFREAIQLRNLIVAQEFDIAVNGFGHILEDFKADTLNERGLTTSLFTNYILPHAEAVIQPLRQLSALEKAYVCRMLTFAYREQIVSRIGNRRKPGNSVADLWNIPLAEKKEIGIIYSELTIVERKKSDANRGFDIVTLAIPDQDKDFLPNFRCGDSVFLYSYTPGTEPDVRRNILLKAVITDISTSQVSVWLNDSQKNPNILATDSLFAIEHCDISGNAPFRAMSAFASAPADRRALLLGQREPRFDKTLTLSHSYHPNYDNIILRAKQARDFFLIMGPPGTGKTSLALRFLIEEELTSGKNPSILLMAYTNRAVDEICQMLSEAHLDYIRIGKEYSCDPRFQNHMIKEEINHMKNPTLHALRTRILNVPIIVGTTLSIQSKSRIFDLKRFSLAIVDEASQILEPNIIGLLCQSIDRFILIGDHKQLPAVVQQSEEESAVEDSLLQEAGIRDCRDSLFERLLRQTKTSAAIGILHRQGRMHPDIAEWPNRMFYKHENLQPVPLPHQLESATEPRLIFIPSDRYPTDASSADPSSSRHQELLSDKVNPEEARIVAGQLRKVYHEYDNFDPMKTVGVIVPYRNQIAMIRHEIEHLGIEPLLHISIDTVERFQGSQRDVIIYSTTVTHRYQLHFLTANTFEENGHVIDRKLNVALTRARRKMIVTGNEPTLRHNTLYANLIDHIQSRGGYIVE